MNNNEIVDKVIEDMNKAMFLKMPKVELRAMIIEATTLARQDERFKTARKIFGFERDWENNETYRKVLRHRNKCGKFGKEFCLECFGGGLTKFIENFRQEKQDGWAD